MKSLLILLLSIYQKLVSPLFVVVFGSHCRHELTCSEFAKEAIEEKGVLNGGKLALRRILSCQPFAKSHMKLETRN